MSVDNNFFEETRQHFNQMHDDWWNPNGVCKLLHRMNPIRLQFTLDQVDRLLNKRILDVGCGGGILSESLAIEGAQVTGLDTAEDLIEVAQRHAQANDIVVNYHNQSIENFIKTNPKSFHIVTCMELLEHLDDPSSMINHCVQLVETGGHIIFSTINRTLAAWLYAIVGAEYILRWLPYHTHQYRNFIKPSELAAAGRKYGLTLRKSQGMRYNLLSKKWSLTQDTSINYLMHFQKI